MSEQRPSDVLGALPRRRPHRRSDKRPAPQGAELSAGAPRPRGARPAKPTAAGASESAQREPVPRATTPRATTPHVPASQRPRQRLHQPAQPPGVPPKPSDRAPAQLGGRHILETAALAAAELAEIGLSVSARALRNAVNRLPRP